MIASATGRRKMVCGYCLNEQSKDGHNNACPLVSPIGPLTGSKIEEWHEGYRVGSFVDKFILYYGLPVTPASFYFRHTPSYVLGFDRGLSVVKKILRDVRGDSDLDEDDPVMVKMFW